MKGGSCWVKTIMLAGHAKLPQGMAAKSVFETLTITAEIDRKYGVIVRASCTLATGHAQGFIGELLKGYSLLDGIDPILDAIKEAYHGKAKQALLAAAKDLYGQFLLYREKQGNKRACERQTSSGREVTIGEQDVTLRGTDDGGRR